MNRVNGAVWVLLAAALTTAVLLASGWVWLLRMTPAILRPYGGV